MSDTVGIPVLHLRFALPSLGPIGAHRHKGTRRDRIVASLPFVNIIECEYVVGIILNFFVNVDHDKGEY